MTPKLALNGGTPVRLIPFPEWPVFDESDEQALLDVLSSGKWGRHQGTRVNAFEVAFAAYQGARYCVAVMNGSVAIKIALLAAGIQAGDEVIVPDYTFVATASSVVEANAVPVFVDIDPDTYCLTPELVEASITDRTRAVIPVHFAGQAVDMEALMALAGRHNLVVIEDAAHAHGAEYEGQRLGSIAHMGCFSFQSSKNLTAGEGGAILTNDEHFERLCYSLQTCGRLPEGEWYEHHLPGGNYRMTEFQAGLLLNQLTRLEQQTQTRDRNGRFLNQILADISGISPLKRDMGETRHAYHLYIFRYNASEFNGLPRERFLEALTAEGIPNSAGYGTPLHRQELFMTRAFGPFTGYQHSQPDLDYAQVHSPVSERACNEEACWLPQSVMLGSESDMNDIARAITKIYENRGELA